MSDDEEDELPSYESLLLDAGLYREYHLLGDWSYVKGLLTGKPLQFDAYCVFCRQTATFRDQRSRGSGAGMPPTRDGEYLADRIFPVPMTCQRNSQHEYHYFLQVKRQAIQKIGQTPSLADVALPTIERFEAVLDKRYISDLAKAVGLFAHGIGAGSFVYLRRVLEKLISDELDAARAENDPALATFASNHLDDKIAVLAHRLPEALIKYKAAYGVLSAGIHELEEEACLEYFAVLKAVIFLILEDHLQAKQRKAAERELQRAFNETNQKVVEAQRSSRKPTARQ